MLMLLAVGLGFGIYEFYLKEVVSPPPAPVARVSPKSAVESALASGSIAAASLAALEAKYPREVLKGLDNRLLRITGDIAKLRVTGIARDTAEITFETPTSRGVRLEIDLNKFQPIRNVRQTRLRYEILGGELIVTDPQSRQIEILFREGQSLSQRARFSNSGAADLIFKTE